MEIFEDKGLLKVNQLMFYASSLTLLLLIYHKKLSIIGIPIVIWITLQSKSDAYFFTLYMTVLFYFLFIFFQFTKLYADNIIKEDPKLEKNENTNLKDLLYIQERDTAIRTLSAG